MCLTTKVLEISNAKVMTVTFLLAWLKKEHIFVESDSLGIDHPVTIGHFIKIAPELTNLVNFHGSLVNQLMLIDINADTAIVLAPHLKDAQLNAMTNGDEYVPILPNVEIYWMQITYGQELTQVMTNVLGVKSMPQDAKLLGKFFTRLVLDTSNNHHESIFLPKGAVHQLGPQM